MPSNPGSRRDFLKWLALSPVLTQAGALVAGEDPAASDHLITSPEQALDVLEFEPVARQKLPPAHFAYLATGVDDDAIIEANRAGFAHWQIRSRRLIDVSHVEQSVQLFGTTWTSPIVIAPVSSQRAFHPEGEVATARAARAREHLQILSTGSTTSIEEVTEARGAPVWYQLYPTNNWAVGRSLIKRAEAAGSPVLVLTVDLHENSNRETLFRSRRVDARDCQVCHQIGLKSSVQRKPMFDGLDLTGVTTLIASDQTWDVIKRIRDATSMKLVIKGIVTREDAELAAGHGVDGLIVSNHGGRSENSNRATIDCLAEVIEGAGPHIPVLVDSGFRRGTDIFKALALGARAVCIGRPYLWGLAAFGQPGVEKVLEILRRELLTIMRQAGTTSIAAITRSSVAGPTQN